MALEDDITALNMLVQRIGQYFKLTMTASNNVQMARMFRAMEPVAANRGNRQAFASR